MEYVEFFRVRKALYWNAGIMALLVLGILSFGHQGTVHIDGAAGSTTLASGAQVPLGALASIAAFFAAIFASSVGASLNRESQTRELSWTKPISRTNLALRFVLIDIASIAVAYAIALAAIVLVVTHFSVTPYMDPDGLTQIVLGVGIGVMWYALLQLLTCMLGPGARALTGIMWPVMLALAGLANLGGTPGQVVRAIDVINPLSYMTNSSVRGGTPASAMSAPIPAGNHWQVLAVWCFSLAFCSIAVAIWPKKEA